MTGGLQTAAALCRRSWSEGVGIYWTLLRLALPLIVAVKILDEAFGVVALLGGAFAPLMGFVDLPGQAGVVFATALLVNIYAAVLLCASLWQELQLSAAQATVLMTMVLVAHALPVELRIARRAGLRFGFGLALRVGGAFVLGALLAQLYGGRFLQEPAVLYLQDAPAQAGWGAWAANEARNWALIFVIIQALTLFLAVLRAVHLERAIAALLSPLFLRMGIGKEATSMAMVGLFLGISYGGGLLIKQAQAGKISRRDALCVLALLSLCHSVIEDTLLVMVLGAHWSGVLVGRLVFALAFMLAFARVVRGMSDAALNKLAPPRALGA